MRLDINVQYHALTELVPKSRWIGRHSSISNAGSEAREHGDADFFAFRTDFIFRYGFADRTELSLDLPYVRHEVNTVESDEHHRDEAIEGLGDIRLSLKHFFVAEEKLQLAGIFGLSFPTGKINKVTIASYLDHEEAAELGIIVPEHTHLRLGTGTFDPFLGVEVLYHLNERWMMYGNVLTNLPFYENRFGYRTSPNINPDGWARRPHRKKTRHRCPSCERLLRGTGSVPWRRPRRPWGHCQRRPRGSEYRAF